MVKIRILGGGQECGRLGILVETEKERFIWDYGVSVQDMAVPLEVKKRIDGIFLSHAHLDHCGHIPYLYKRGFARQTHMTSATADLAAIMLRDSIKVQSHQGLTPSFSELDIETFERQTKRLEFKEKIAFGDTDIELRDAGHVPGAAQVLMDTKKQRVVFTGDIKFEQTKLMRGADMSYKNIDVLVSESTYSHSNHPSRKSIEKSLLQTIKETHQKGGHTLLPAFAIGRTQELLSIVAQSKLPIYLDGMGMKCTHEMLHNPSSVLDYKQLKKAFGKAHKIQSPGHRRAALKEPSVIITTSGMLNGGPINFYIQKLRKREHCSLVFTGFQVPGTVGHTLKNTGTYDNNGFKFKPKFTIDALDFSAHAGRDSLVKFYKKVNPKTILLVHGEKSKAFAEELNHEGFNAVAPKVGQSVTV